MLSMLVLQKEAGSWGLIVPCLRSKSINSRSQTRPQKHGFKAGKGIVVLSYSIALHLWPERSPEKINIFHRLLEMALWVAEDRLLYLMKPVAGSKSCHWVRRHRLEGEQWFLKRLLFAHSLIFWGSRSYRSFCDARLFYQWYIMCFLLNSFIGPSAAGMVWQSSLSFRAESGLLLLHWMCPPSTIAALKMSNN